MKSESVLGSALTTATVGWCEILARSGTLIFGMLAQMIVPAIVTPKSADVFIGQPRLPALNRMSLEKIVFDLH